MRFALATTRIFVAGAGKIGQGIAEVAASSGIEVVLSDVSAKKLELGLKGIESSLNQAIERWAITASEKKAILSRIQTVVGLKAVKGCQFAIEAVPENIDIKKEIFKEFDKVFSSQTIFVTNTSTLSITEIGSVTRRTDRVVGMHFLYPVPKVEVVEVVRALHTSDETFDSAKNFAAQLGKTVVEVYEYPGFVTTRIIVPFINEAAYALMEGVASAKDIDTAMKLGFGLLFGPLELADMIGLDEVLLWMNGLFRELGDFKYRPCPLIKRMVREGRLGRKTGRGFFEYNKVGERRN